jgi:Flp pilus assembly protein CpaB
MGGRRLIAILIGLAGLILLFVVVFSLMRGDDTPPAQGAPTLGPTVDATALALGTPAATSSPVPTVSDPTALVEVVVSLQTVPRGWQMTEAELQTDMRLASEVASNALTVVEDAIGLYARRDIYQGETLTTDTLVRDPTLMGIEEFGPSSLVPSGWVAMAVPMDRLSGVAYGLAPGDSVDVMLTFILNRMDEQLQTLLFNSATFVLTPQAEGDEQPRPTLFVIDPYGRFESLPAGELSHIQPAELTERPVPVSVILQSARVISVGPWKPEEPPRPPTATPLPATEATPTPGAPLPTPTPFAPSVLLVALPPQQQLFLKFAVEVSADIDFALRGVNDVELYTVEQVDLPWLLGQFGIQVPPNMEYTPGRFDDTPPSPLGGPPAQPEPEQ